MKGYNDYENNYKEFAETFKPIEVPEDLKEPEAIQVDILGIEEKPVEPKKRKTLSVFMSSFKNGIIEMFKEEGDEQL